MSEDEPRPVTFSPPPNYRLAMWLVIIPPASMGPLRNFGSSLFEDYSYLGPLLDAFSSLLYATYAIYFAYLVIDILHRFDGFHAADPWIWLFASAQATLMGISAFDSLWSTVDIIVIIERVVRDVISGIMLLAGIAVWLSMRANSQDGLLGSCRLYRWVVLGVGIFPIASSLLFWVNESIWEIEFVVFSLVFVLYVFLHPILFYRASRALRAEAKRAIESNAVGRANE